MYLNDVFASAGLPHYITAQKQKGKGHTLDIAPRSERTSLQKRSGMARVVEGFYSFNCTPTRNRRMDPRVGSGA